MDTIKDTGGSRSLVEDLRALERRQDEIAADLAREAQPEQLVELHPNWPLPAIDAVMFYPESGRGQYRLEFTR